jgi:uncharacterized protein DUF992
MKTLLARASILAALALGVPSLAHAEVRVGTLACHQQPGWGYFIGSSRRVTCQFESAGAVSYYNGRMTEAGVDVGYHGNAQMVWAVFAPTSHVGPGALAGQYGGATAGGAIGLGVAASGLVGSSDRTFHLQPFSVTGKTGLHVTAGIQGMTLIYEPPRVARAYAQPPPYEPAHVYEPVHAAYAPVHAVYAPEHFVHHRRHASTPRHHQVCVPPRA